MSRQTPLRPDDLPTGRSVGLDDRPLSLSRPVDQEDHRIGSLQAPVQLVEYGDYECPFCAEASPGVRDLISQGAQRSAPFRVQALSAGQSASTCLARRSSD